MATLDWSQCPAVESIPGKVSGAWVFRDTRLPVATVIENLEDLSIEEVMEQFDVTREQITAVLDFVAQSLKVSAPEQPSGPVETDTVLLGAGHAHVEVLRRFGEARLRVTGSSMLPTVWPGDLVAVQGVGGLGHLGIQFAKKAGYRVAAVGRGR